MNLKKLNLTVLLVTILVLVPTIQIVYASPLSTLYLSGGVYPQGHYTIWHEGSTYYAKNRFGYLEFSGTNASKVVNDCIDAFRSDEGAYGYEAGIIHFVNGYYIFDSPIIVNKPNVIIEGEGRATELRPSGVTPPESIILVYTPTTAVTNTHATVIRNLIFYNPNWATKNSTIAIHYHNNITATYGISFPSVDTCWFTRIDPISTDTTGFADWEHTLLEGLRVTNCIFDHPPHFGLKIYNAIDGWIENIYASFEDSNTTGIEFVYPYPLSTGYYFTDVSIVGATVGINFTGGCEGWFSRC